MAQRHPEINILQWNARSIFNKKGKIENLISKLQLYVIIITETWLKSNTTIRMNGYTTFRTDRDDCYGGYIVTCMST